MALGSRQAEKQQIRRKKTRYKGDDRSFNIETTLRNTIPRRILSGVTVVVEDHDIFRSLVAEFLAASIAAPPIIKPKKKAISARLAERRNLYVCDVPRGNSKSVRLLFQHLAHFLCALSELFLKFPNQLVILAFSVGEVVVGQLSVLLLKLTFDFIPGALELEFVHISYSELGRAVGCIKPGVFA